MYNPKTLPRPTSRSATNPSPTDQCSTDKPGPHKTLIVLRQDPGQPGSAPLPALYAGIAGHDVLVCTTGADQTGPGRLAAGAEALAGLGLFMHPQYASRCRDYLLYAARAAWPDYAQYWLLSAELRINAPGTADFFTRLAAVEADLLAAKLGRRGPGWGWGDKLRGQPGAGDGGGGEAGAADVHGCVFPIIRLSARALDTLLDLRRRQSADPALASPQAWPNDEAFVATMAARHGLAAKDLNDCAPAAPCYTDESLTGPCVLDAAQLAASPPDGLLYHPVRDLEAWTGQVELAAIGAPARLRSLQDPAGMRTQPGAALLDRLGHSCLRHPALNGAALVPLMLAESLWRTRPWVKGDGEPANAVGRERVCALSLQRGFGGGPTVATAHLALSKLSKNNLMHVQPGDFELGEGVKLGRLPTTHALPYAYDFAARELHFTLHASLAGVLSRPFLYSAQREMARVVARVPTARLAEVYGTQDKSIDPVLIFSIGRTGSTLFQKLIGCVTPRSFSEPDTITQMVESQLTYKMPEDERDFHLYYALAPLLRVRLPGGVDGPCVIKLRSQTNGLSRDMARAFPDAKFVFMLREHRAWARSTFRSFNLTPLLVVNRLVQALLALRKLQDARVDLRLVFYEDLVANPRAVVAALTGADPATDPELSARIAAVAAEDSQAGHALARTHTSKTGRDEEAWMAEFDRLWAERRPARVVERLGLNF